MSEQRVSYNATMPIGEIKQQQFTFEKWEMDIVLQLRLAARSGFIVTCDPVKRCWWTSGKVQCSKEDQELPFKMD